MNEHRVVSLLRAISQYAIFAQNHLQLPHAFSDDIAQLRKNMAKLEEELRAKASDTGGRADRADGASP